ncbi:MAG: TolC family protein, partial [Acidobacteriota bacterium]
DGARAAVRVRQAADQPTVGLSGGFTRTNHVDEFGVPTPAGGLRIIYPDIPNNTHTRVSLQWPIYTAGRADALERAARAEAAAAAADIETARADLRLEVVRAYWALATATEAVAVLERALERAEAHLADMRQRLAVGLVPPNEVLTVDAQRSRQRMLLIEARNQREAASVDLARLVGLDPGTAVATSDALGPKAPTEAPARLSDALAARPERQALTLRIDGAAARHQAASAGRRPTVAVTGGVDYASPNPRIFPRADVWRESWDLSVNATWTFWDGGRTDAEAAEAAAAERAVRARLADFDRLMASDLRQRQLDLDSADAAIAAAGDGVRAAAEARRVVAERFTAGVATSTEVLDADVALLQAELDRTRALAARRLAEARLDRVMGRR